MYPKLIPLPVMLWKTGSQIGGKAQLPGKRRNRYRGDSCPLRALSTSWWLSHLISVKDVYFQPPSCMLPRWPRPMPLAGLKRRQDSLTFLDCLSRESGICNGERKRGSMERNWLFLFLPGPCFLHWKALRLLRVKQTVPDVSLLDDKGRECF